MSRVFCLVSLVPSHLSYPCSHHQHRWRTLGGAGPLANDRWPMDLPPPRRGPLRGCCRTAEIPHGMRREPKLGTKSYSFRTFSCKNKYECCPSCLAFRRQSSRSEGCVSPHLKEERGRPSHRGGAPLGTPIRPDASHSLLVVTAVCALSILCREGVSCMLGVVGACVSSAAQSKLTVHRLSCLCRIAR